MVDAGRERLLAVRDVAEQLAVATATVYALVERGELAHVRVSNAIRIAPAALDRYLGRGGGLQPKNFAGAGSLGQNGAP